MELFDNLAYGFSVAVSVENLLWCLFGVTLGTFIGVLILRMMRNGIVMVGVPGLAYNIFIGAIILGMMSLHSWLERRHNAGT